VFSAAKQSAAPDKLPNPPRCGGKSKERPGFRSAERCLGSRLRRSPVIQRRFPEEDMVSLASPTGFQEFAAEQAGAVPPPPVNQWRFGAVELFIQREIVALLQRELGNARRIAV